MQSVSSWIFQSFQLVKEYIMSSTSSVNAISSSHTSSRVNKLRMKHDAAYACISEALALEESGNGKEALNSYQCGCAKIRQALDISIPAADCNEDVTALRSKMERNLPLFNQRIHALTKKYKKSPAATPATSTPALPKSSPTNIASSSKFLLPSNNTESNIARESRNKLNSEEVKRLFKGVDYKLVTRILDEVIDSSCGVSWDDVVGVEAAKQALHELVVLPSLRPDLFVGLRQPARGLLLFGPPGNGKTMLARALAGASKANFFNISASVLTSKWVGEGEKLVRALFTVASAVAPSIIFIDEIDSVLFERGSNEHEATRRLKNELLLALDGLGTNLDSRVLLLGATNRPQELDDAALRRMPKRIYIPLPDMNTRIALIDRLLSKDLVRHSLSSREKKRLAESLDGYSASDITQVARDAALGPLRDLSVEQITQLPSDMVRPIRMSDFESSIKRIPKSINTESLKAMENWGSEFGTTTK